MISVSTPDGEMGLFVARPEGDGPFPGLIVIQEAFGVNGHIQDVAQRFADQGYYAVAPELFHRFEVKDVPYGEYRTAMGMLGQMDDARIMNDVNAALSYLRGQSDVRHDRLGIVGYCFGGKVAYLAATKSDAFSAVASYYGGGIAKPTDPNAPIHASAQIQAPIKLFFGEEDQAIPLEQIRAIDETLARLGKEHEVVTYPGAGHAFHCDARPAGYNPAAASDAWKKTIAFFDEKLKR
ncbi:MAG: dienelactone hydrolase family protein [Chloroflexota bacterium]